MFDLGVQELVVIFAVALIVFGPKRLPELAKTLGKGVGHVRKAMFDIKAGVEREIEAETAGELKNAGLGVPSLKENGQLEVAARGPMEEAGEEVEGLKKSAAEGGTPRGLEDKEEKDAARGPAA